MRSINATSYAWKIMVAEAAGEIIEQHGNSEEEPGRCRVTDNSAPYYVSLTEEEETR